jgi:5-(carboxyamino)imidazole ribonucleotide mutase
MEVFRKVSQVLDDFGVSYDRRILSAHRTPELLKNHVLEAEREGTRVFIAVAGMSAALPGVIASHTIRPVIGVPAASNSPVLGFDSMLSVVQMPPGIPVAAVSVNGGTNAGLLAVEILALDDPSLAAKLAAFRAKQRDKAAALDEDFRKRGGK